MGDRPHEIPFDVRQAVSGQFAKEYLIRGLKENPDTDVVRSTTFFYHFTLVFNQEAKEKFVDGFGYGGTVSVKALQEFEAKYGCRLRPEDLVEYALPGAHKGVSGLHGFYPVVCGGKGGGAGGAGP